jgi:hypothetical protein
MRRLMFFLLRMTSIIIYLIFFSACESQIEPATNELDNFPAENIVNRPFAPVGSTYYIRTDGGSYAQCTGLSDAAYPGSGFDQPCAWDHPLRALPPRQSPHIQGGDTLIISEGSYMMGYGAPGSSICESEDSYDCVMSAIPSGPDASHPTRILGKGWDTGCTSPPELWGTGRSWYVFNMTGSSNVEVNCLDLTDHSSCIEDHMHPVGGSKFTCQRNTAPYGDWASIGLYAEDSSNVALRNLNIHGLANTGIQAGRLTDWTVENVRLAANGWAGWNGDLVGDGSNSENHGTLIFRNWLVEWNGCGESYPEKEIIGCWGQEAGGYGDGAGFGGITGGHTIIEDSAFLHNTSDGLDLLYNRLPDAMVEIHRIISAGNAGNQVKITGRSLIENSLLISNCDFFHGMEFWNKDDDCRALGDALLLSINPNGRAKIINSTITGNGNCLLVAECAQDKNCTGNEIVSVQNVLFQGQGSIIYPGEDTCFAWFDDETSASFPGNPFRITYSLISDTRFGNALPCSGEGNICDIEAYLENSDINNFDAHLQSDSPAVNAGNPVGAPMVDLEGNPRQNNPDIGAYEYKK